jgi:hypothetical protein
MNDQEPGGGLVRGALPWEVEAGGRPRPPDPVLPWERVVLSVVIPVYNERTRWSGSWSGCGGCRSSSR